MNGGAKRRYSLFPKTLEECIAPVTKPIFKAQGLAGSRILTQWESIVGPTLSCHTIPEKLSFPPGKKTGGTLTIATESGFATQLMHLQPVILERLAIYFGYPAINRIVISHSWQRQETPLMPQAIRRIPLSSSIFQEVQAVADPELKEALSSLAKALATPPSNMT